MDVLEGLFYSTLKVLHHLFTIYIDIDFFTSSVVPLLSLKSFFSPFSLPFSYPSLCLSLYFSISISISSLCFNKVMTIIDEDRDLSDEGILKEADVALFEVSPTYYILALSCLSYPRMYKISLCFSHFLWKRTGR